MYPNLIPYEFNRLAHSTTLTEALLFLCCFCFLSRISRRSLAPFNLISSLGSANCQNMSNNVLSCVFGAPVFVSTWVAKAAILNFNFLISPVIIMTFKCKKLQISSYFLKYTNLKIKFKYLFSTDKTLNFISVEINLFKATSGSCESDVHFPRCRISMMTLIGV